MESLVPIFSAEMGGQRSTEPRRLGRRPASGLLSQTWFYTLCYGLSRLRLLIGMLSHSINSLGYDLISSLTISVAGSLRVPGQYAGWRPANAASRHSHVPYPWHGRSCRDVQLRIDVPWQLFRDVRPPCCAHLLPL